MLKEAREKGILNKNYPGLSPAFLLRKEEREDLNQGKVLVLRDDKYKEEFLLRKEDMSKELTPENIHITSLNKNIDFENDVRRRELDIFYIDHPQYKR